MNAGPIVQAAGLFAVTNIDDILILSLSFAQGAGHRGSATRVAVGQYLGFLAILVVAVAAALGATLLPGNLIPYLGLLPLGLGIRAEWRVWTERRRGADTPRSPHRGQAGRRQGS
jgi:cadmium resistance protein CadD (predicted permease)